MEMLEKILLFHKTVAHTECLLKHRKQIYLDKLKKMTSNWKKIIQNAILKITFIAF